VQYIIVYLANYIHNFHLIYIINTIINITNIFNVKSDLKFLIYKCYETANFTSKLVIICIILYNNNNNNNNKLRCYI